jgi:hypothetical protein
MSTPEFSAPSRTEPPPVSVAPLAKPHAAPPLPASAREAIPLGAIALASAAALVLVALAFPRHPSPPAPHDDAGVSQPAAVASPPITAPLAPSAPSLSPAVSAPSPKIAVAKPARNRVAESPITATLMAPPVAPASVDEDAAKSLAETENRPAPLPSSASPAIGAAAPVTITGCLEISVNHDEFRLTDTDGAAAPRSRSWRTGFLKKHSAAVALVAPADGLALQTHVGRRVAATGLLTSHDLKVSALRVVGACN